MEKTTLNIPNIFDYPTSKLTQDTFLTCLLQWADKKLEKINPSLHSCACDMLELFLDEKIDVDSVEVYKQYEDIDSWFTFNDNTIPIMEDKTSSTVHNTQFEDYKNTAEAWWNKKLDEYKI